MGLPYKVKQVTACGTPYTVGQAKSFVDAKRIAHMNHKITGKYCQIKYKGKVLGY